MSAIKKPNIVRAVLSVKETRLITPHYIRVVFAMTDEQATLFGKVTIGAHNKLFIPVSGSAEPVVRTYTTRHIDYTSKELWVDFIAHGDNGPASRWANQAKAGDRLEVAMKEGNKPLLPQAHTYLLAGDSTALPVIAAMLNHLPEYVKVTVILEVYSPDDEHTLYSEAQVQVQWLHNPAPEQGSRLGEAIIEAVQATAGNHYMFVAAEQDTARQVKRFLKEALTLPATSYTVVSYWKRGASEDDFVPDR